MPPVQDRSGSGEGANRLRWSRERLLDELDGQLTAGVAILEQFAMEPPAEADVRRWSERNQTILEQAFTQPDEADRYITLGPNAQVWSPTASKEARVRQGVAFRKDWFQRRYQFVHSLRERVDLFEEQRSVPGASGASTAASGQEIFLVHGHDDALKDKVSRVVAQLTGRDPVILHEHPDRGRTIIEKFEEHADQAGAAVVLLTPDDEGRAASDRAQGRMEARARQNVIYELGWFHGRLGRGKVIALLAGGLTEPSDIDGVLYVPVDEGGGWKAKLGLELREAGIDADVNNLR